MRAISRQQVEAMKMQLPVLEAFAALKRQLAHACNTEAEDAKVGGGHPQMATAERARAQCELVSMEVLQIDSQIAVIRAAIAEAESPTPMISKPGQFT